MVCYCELLTPQRILDETEADVFETIIPNTEYLYEDKRAALWAMYRHRFIGSCDVNSWKQVMADRYLLIKREYDLKLRAFNEMVTSIGTNGIDLSSSGAESEVTTTFEDTPDSPVYSTGEYLSNRTKTKTAGKGYDGLQTDTVRSWMDGVAIDPLRSFADEFEDLFVYC